MVTMIAAKVLELASTTCNRNFCKFEGLREPTDDRLFQAN